MALPYARNARTHRVHLGLLPPRGVDACGTPCRVGALSSYRRAEGERRQEEEEQLMLLCFIPLLQMHDDGTMYRRDDSLAFASAHKIPIVPASTPRNLGEDKLRFPGR